MRTWAVIGVLAMVSGCGESAEDFAVEVRKSPSEVASAIARLDFGTQQAAFPSLVVKTSRPSESEIVYTIPVREVPSGISKEDAPKASSKQSVIRLTLEPIGDGAGTRIHAAVDVPPVRVMMGEANKALSEEKVEHELRKALAELSPARLRELLVAVAVSSSIDLQSQVNVANAERERPGSVDWGPMGEE